MPDLDMAALPSSNATMHADRDYAYLRASMTVTIVTEVSSRSWVIRFELLLAVGIGTRPPRLAARNRSPDDCTGRQGAQRGSAAVIAMPPTITSMAAVMPSPMMPAPIPNVLDVRRTRLGQGLYEHRGRGGGLAKCQHGNAENA